PLQWRGRASALSVSAPRRPRRAAATRPRAAARPGPLDRARLRRGPRRGGTSSPTSLFVHRLVEVFQVTLDLANIPAHLIRNVRSRIPLPPEFDDRAAHLVDSRHQPIPHLVGLCPLAGGRFIGAELYVLPIDIPGQEWPLPAHVPLQGVTTPIFIDNFL